MKRRSFLSVLGAMVAAPTLLIKEVANPAPRIGMPFLFDIPLSALHPGGMTTVIGQCGVGKTALLRSVAMDASKGSSVGLVCQEINSCNKLDATNNFSGNLQVYPEAHLNFSAFEEIFDKHDVVVIDDFYQYLPYNDVPLYQSANDFIYNIDQLARKNGTHVIISAMTRQKLSAWTSLIGDSKLKGAKFETDKFYQQSPMLLSYSSSSIYRLENDNKWDVVTAKQIKNRQGECRDFIFRIQPNLTVSVKRNITEQVPV